MGKVSADDEVERLARDFYRRVGLDADDNAFVQFTRARGIAKPQADAIRQHLASRYRMHGFGPRRMAEGIGYSDDADGRGRAPGGGSPFDGSDRVASVATSDRTCPKCGENLEPGQRYCDTCDSVALNGAAEIGGMGSAGAKQRAITGHVRIPGGPIDSNESGPHLSVRVLSPTLVEVAVGGSAQLHSWSNATSGIAFGLSAYGRAASSAWVPMVNEWLWQHALPGDQLVVTLDGRQAFVMDKTGFRRNLRR